MTLNGVKNMWLRCEHQIPNCKKKKKKYREIIRNFRWKFNFNSSMMPCASTQSHWKNLIGIFSRKLGLFLIVSHIAAVSTYHRHTSDCLIVVNNSQCCFISVDVVCATMRLLHSIIVISRKCF